MGVLWDAITGAEQARGEELDRRKAELDARARARGAWTPENDAIVQEHAAQQSADTADMTASVIDAAEEGAQEGLNQTADTIRSTVNTVASSTASFVWSAIPGWLWLVGAAVALGYAYSLGLIPRFRK